MLIKTLFIFVEGNDDKRFFENILVPPSFTKPKRIIKYAEMKKGDIINSLLNFTQNQNEYLLVGDLNSHSCITSKKRELLELYPPLERPKIIIVVKEIESWYLAGLSDADYKKLGITPILANTDNVGKKKFQEYMPKKFDLTEFKIELLKHFSIPTAKQKNSSFRYFAEKYLR